MEHKGFKAKNDSLDYLGIKKAKTVYWNLSPAELSEHTLERNQGVLTDTGALSINTGEFTGRSPKDRFVVADNITENTVWWGNINIKFDPAHYDSLRAKVLNYLEDKDLFAKDSFVCADPNYRMNVRTVVEYPWSSLFTHNLFLRPDRAELDNYSPDWTVICAPGFKADPAIDHTRQHNFAIINFTKKEILVGGTGYTGEMKKGIFGVLNFILPHEKNVLSMHCSANIGEEGDTAIFFGLSGTGKTTLSADPDRKLIGDDEHGWAENSVFNFEGGCYAKCINLTEENEPDIYRAIKFGALVENIGFFPNTRTVNYEDTHITENTRVAYPIEHIENIAKPSIGPKPKNIFFLTCDAFGVLPPISKLTKSQAMYHFISGYTAKVAGTEMGITEPQVTFSACFGAAFLPLHPAKYAQLLGEKMEKDQVNVWLINTGWAGGGYGVGSRMKLKFTRAMITAALKGELENVEYETTSIFKLNVPTTCPNVPSEVLRPKDYWKDKDAFWATADKLAKQFVENFKKYEEGSSAEILAAAPIIRS